MSKIALKDVVHYYIGQKCRYKHPFNDEWTQWGNLIFKYLVEGYNIQLALRRLEDMTQEHYKALENSLSIDITFSVKSLYLYWKDKPKHVTVIMNRLGTNNLCFNDGLILLKEGFDLFGLIDSGQAVDAKTLNP